jgi:mono/diheme cytochrome c family protein
MSKSAIALLIFASVVFSASAQQNQKPPDGVLPADSSAAAQASAQTNSVKPTAESIAQGKKVYGYDCAMCHGVDGGGKGDLAVDMKLKIPDYRDPASMKDMTDADLFRIIQKGKGDMPQEGDRVKPEGIWNLVNYVRSFAKKEDASKEKPTSP